MAGTLISQAKLTTPAGTDLIPLARPGDTTARYATVSSLYDTTASALNVKEYGALGDGVTDDTAAIQSAIDSVGATTYYCNLELYFPVGTYLVTSSIDLTDKRNVVIAGAGGGYDGYGTTKILSQANGKPALDLSGSANISMRDITIHGDNTNSPSCGILLARSTAANGENSAFNTFRNVFVTGYYTVSALYSWSSEVNKYDKCMFENNDTSGKCCAYFGGRNKYTITSDYVTFSTTNSHAVGRIIDCSFNFYNATSPDGFIVLHHGPTNIVFDGGYINGDLTCPVFLCEGNLSHIRLNEFYPETSNTDSFVKFDMYDVNGTAHDFTIDGGADGITNTSYFIDQVAGHTINRMRIDNVRSRLSGSTSAMRFLGTVSDSIFRHWWTFDAGSITFNVLYHSEVWYHTHTVTITTDTNNIWLDQQNWAQLFSTRSLKVGTRADDTAGRLAIVSKVLTATATWDPGSVADGASTYNAVALSGVAADGTWVTWASLSSLTTGYWQIAAYPIGNYVQVILTNHTGSPVDLGSGTLRVVAMKVA